LAPFVDNVTLGDSFHNVMYNSAALAHRTSPLH